MNCRTLALIPALLTAASAVAAEDNAGPQFRLLSEFAQPFGLSEVATRFASPSGPGMRSIEEWGCRAIRDDPEFDNAPLLNGIFAAAGRQHFDAIYIPGKSYRINDTVRIPARWGVAVIGTGITMFTAQGEHEGGRKGGPASRLVWRGPPDRPMVSFAGAGLYWRGVSLFGQFARGSTNASKEDLGQRATIGLRIEGQQNGIGTGKIYVPQISICNCDVGIQFGGAGGANNADNAVLGYLQTQNCRIGFYAKEPQSVSHVVQHYKPYFTDTAFRFDRSGKLRCYSLDVSTPCVVLSLGRTMATTGTFQFFGTTIDNGAVKLGDQGYRLVDSPELMSSATITFQGVHFPHDYPPDYAQPFANLVGNDRLTLRDAYRVPAGDRGVTGKAKKAQWGRGSNRRTVTLMPSVLLDNCRVDKPQDVARGAYVQWQNCYNFFGQPLEDGSTNL